MLPTESCSGVRTWNISPNMSGESRSATGLRTDVTNGERSPYAISSGVVPFTFSSASGGMPLADCTAPAANPATAAPPFRNPLRFDFMVLSMALSSADEVTWFPGLPDVARIQLWNARDTRFPCERMRNRGLLRRPLTGKCQDRILGQQVMATTPLRVHRHHAHWTRLSNGNRRANLRKLTDQAARPPVDIVLADVGAHALHADAALFRRHLQSAVDRVRHLVRVVRIHQERIGQLMARAGEAAQDQHALVVVARRHEFLCNQIHAVVQRRDQAEISGPVVGKNFGLAVLLGQ